MGITRYSGNYSEKSKNEDQTEEEKNKNGVSSDDAAGSDGNGSNSDPMSDEQIKEIHHEIEKEAAGGIGSIFRRMRHSVDSSSESISHMFELLEKDKAMEYKNYTHDIKETADWAAYKKGYGRAYFVIMMCAIPGIAFFIVMSILNLGFGIRMTIPIGFSLLSWLITVFYTGSIAAIPITLFIRRHSFNRLKKDYLLFKKNTVIYHKEILDEMIEKERTHIYHEYRLIVINPKYEETEGYFKIRGLVEKTEFFNDKARKKETRGQVNIPKTFNNMELLHEYAPDPDIKFEKFFEWGFGD